MRLGGARASSGAEHPTWHLIVYSILKDTGGRPYRWRRCYAICSTTSSHFIGSDRLSAGQSISKHRAAPANNDEFALVGQIADVWRGFQRALKPSAFQGYYHNCKRHRVSIGTRTRSVQHQSLRCAHYGRTVRHFVTNVLTRNICLVMFDKLRSKSG